MKKVDTQKQENQDSTQSNIIKMKPPKDQLKKI